MKKLLTLLVITLTGCSYTDRIALEDGHEVCTLSYVNLLSPSITVARSCDIKEPVNYAASEDGIGGRVIEAGLSSVVPSLLISDAIKSLRFPGDSTSVYGGGASASVSAPTYNLNSNTNSNVNAIIGGAR